MSNYQLGRIAAELAADAGADPGYNRNEAGFWRSISNSLEVIASFSYPTNNNIGGYMLRAAKAAEFLGGTTGAEENPNEMGYVKRIVDGLEAEVGQVFTGSLYHRFFQAATALGGG